MERLIVCQGTAQLVTAVAALRQHIKRSVLNERLQQSREHLLICGLAVPEVQAAEFADVIYQMASLLHPFATIIRLSDARLEQLLCDSRRVSSTGIAALLKDATGISVVNEVFTVRDWQPCNNLALNAFPDAKHICYGDSVGVYLPRDFMARRPTVLSRITTWLHQLMSPRCALLANPRLDVSYLLLPGAFGIPPSGKVVRTESTVLRSLFSLLSPLLDGTSLDDIHKRIAGKHVWVLMGSNFSEQGMMMQEREISAYRDWIASLRPDPDTVLLIKSHPRDRMGKSELVAQHLRDLFCDVCSADSVGSAYLPMEVLLLDLIPLAASIQCLTVSTACLATHFVVESKTHIGFGDELVAKYFAAGRRQERCTHEQDLLRLCTD